MDVIRLLVTVVVTGTVGLTAEAHPAPEQHPTVQELEETAADLRRAIGDVERRLRERIDGAEAVAGEPDGETTAEVVNRAVDEATANLERSTGALNDRVDTIVALGATLLAGLVGVSAFLGLRQRALRTTLSRLGEGARGAEDAAGTKRSHTGLQGEGDEENEEAGDVEPPEDEKPVTTSEDSGVTNSYRDLKIETSLGRLGEDVSFVARKQHGGGYSIRVRSTNHKKLLVSENKEPYTLEEAEGFLADIHDAVLAGKVRRVIKPPEDGEDDQD